MSDIDDELLRYDKIVEDALRSVVRTALTQVADFGLPGNHSLYIAFLTDYPGVVLPDHLKQEYPEEITIVLEHQFWDLAVGEEHFEVTLSFRRRREHIVVPYDAITSFADPSVQFGLKFEAVPPDEAGGITDGAAESPGPGANAAEAAQEEALDEEEDKTGEVVNLDQFRKNN